MQVDLDLMVMEMSPCRGSIEWRRSRESGGGGTSWFLSWVSDEFVEVPLDSRGGDLEELQEKLMNIGTISTK